MKRTIIALAITALMVLTACDDMTKTAKQYQAERIAVERPIGKHVLHCIGTTYGTEMSKAVIMDCYEVE